MIIPVARVIMRNRDKARVVRVTASLNISFLLKPYENIDYKNNYIELNYSQNVYTLT